MYSAIEPVKVLVVDDSAFMRKVITDILQSDSGIQIVGSAKNGREALEKIAELKPDVVTLDVEMPVMGGLECLEKIMDLHPLPVVMLSSVTRKGADETIIALEHGAMDFITKPSNIFSITGKDIQQELIEKVKVAAVTSIKKLKSLSVQTSAEKSIPFKTSSYNSTPKEGIMEATREIAKEIPKVITDKTSAAKITPINAGNTDIPKTSAEVQKSKTAPDTYAKVPGIIAIGTSTGGPRALQDVIPRIPGNIPAAVLIVQHMPPGFTKSLAERLDSLSEIKVKEGEDGEIIKAGCAYIAPGGYHMLVEKTGKDEILRLRLSGSEPVGGHRPAVNVMMDSISSLKMQKIIGVIMTGMGSDGCEGLKKIKNINKGYIIAQEEGTCVVYGMPKAAVQAGIVDKVVPLKEITGEIIRIMEVYS